MAEAEQEGRDTTDERQAARWLRWIGLALLVVFIGIQFVQKEHTNPPIQSELAAPDGVQTILRRSCYDCHSNETRWPWYSRIAPVSWYTVGHVNHARSDMNFSEWPTFDPEEQEHLLEEIREMMDDQQENIFVDQPDLLAQRLTDWIAKHFHSPDYAH